MSKKALKKPKLNKNSLQVLKARYLKKDKNNKKTIETPKELFWRVAKTAAKADESYSTDKKQIEKLAKDFYNIMADIDFLPNSPTLMNAGRKLGQLSACFVLPIEDSMESIFESIKTTALIHQSGGGTGFSFSQLRPKNDIVKSTQGKASGPVSFMSVFNAATDTVKQGGKRRGANMGILNVTHPDILEFIDCKKDGKSFSNFNISVNLTDDFIKRAKLNKKYSLINPRNKKVVKRISAKKVFDKITNNAWKNGDPGIIFIDQVNKFNSTPKIGEIESTNPCGEQPLLPYESCNLGSINLANMLTTKKDKTIIDWGKIEKTTKLAVNFLDNIIDINTLPVPQINEMTKANRKIGLGVMGWADMLIQLNIPYNSEKAFKLAERVMKHIYSKAQKASQQLAKIRGVFPNWDKSIYKSKKIKIRNATITTIAPTGSIGVIAGASSGVEPLFAISYIRKTPQFELCETNPYFEKILKKEGVYSKKLIKKVAKSASIQNIDEIPAKIKKIFVTAHDITPEDHIKMQAAFQKYIDNAVSKTINFPQNTEVDDIKKAYLLAFKLKCKGLTIYRDKSRDEQVLNVEESDKKLKEQEAKATVKIVPRKRPDRIFGTTYKMPTGYGNLYITINEDENHDPFEIFTHIGKAGGFFAAKAEAISRLISLAMRSGIDPREIIDQLKGIRGPNPVWGEKEMILSLPDAIGKVLEKHLSKSQEQLSLDYIKKEKTEKITFSKQNSDGGKSIAHSGLAPICPDCGQMMQMGEGCLSCRSCGYSKCN